MSKTTETVQAFPLQWPAGWKATDRVLDAQHRRLAMKHHPDRGGDAERMADINAARDQGLEAIR